MKITTARSVNLQYGKESFVVTQPTEETVTNGLIRVTGATKKAVYFAEGDGEADIADQQEPKGYAGAKLALEQENYEVKPLVLPAAESIPDDASALVLAGPARPLDEHEVQALDAYLKRGGHLLALVGPREGGDRLNGFLADWGVKVGNDIVIDRELRLFAGPSMGITPITKTYGAHPITQNFRDYTQYPQTRTVEPDSTGKKGIQATALVKTSASSRALAKVDELFSKGTATVEETDRKGPLTVAVAVTAKPKDLGVTPPAREEGKKAKLLGVDKDAITGIDLVFPDREIELKKGDQGWRIVKPVDAPADDPAVKGVVNTLADAEVQRTLDEAPQDLAAFGLDKPNPLVKITVKSGAEPPPIAVGKNTAIGGKSYVRKGDEPKLYLTTSSLQYALNKQAKDLRDKQLVNFQDDDVQRVDITGDGKTTTLARKGKDAWVVEPGDLPADLTEVRSYLSTLRSTRASEFPDDAPADLGKYGLDQPKLTVTIATGKDGAETQSLLLGSEGTQGTQKLVYAKRASQPTVYGVGDWTTRSLGKDRKSTRLNSSHSQISYAVFCLKKKKQTAPLISCARPSRMGISRSRGRHHPPLTSFSSLLPSLRCTIRRDGICPDSSARRATRD